MASQTYFLRSKGWAIAFVMMGLFSACRKETVQLVYKPCPGAELVRDVEQNTYPTVQIGDQCWLRENLGPPATATGMKFRSSRKTPFGYQPRRELSPFIPTIQTRIPWRVCFTIILRLAITEAFALPAGMFQPMPNGQRCRNTSAEATRKGALSRIPWVGIFPTPARPIWWVTGQGRPVFGPQQGVLVGRASTVSGGLPPGPIRARPGAGNSITLRQACSVIPTFYCSVCRCVASKTEASLNFRFI